MDAGHAIERPKTYTYPRVHHAIITASFIVCDDAMSFKDVVFSLRETHILNITPLFILENTCWITLSSPTRNPAFF